MTNIAELDTELVGAARAIVDALAAVALARARRSRAVAPYVNALGMTAPAAAIHARGTLLRAGFTDNEIRVVGVSAETIGPAARHARELTTD